MSPALVGELDYLIRHNGPAPATLSELHLEYASLLGWIGGPVIAMLDQLQQGAAGVIGQGSAAS